MKKLLYRLFNLMVNVILASYFLFGREWLSSWEYFDSLEIYFNVWIGLLFVIYALVNFLDIIQLYLEEKLEELESLPKDLGL